MELSGSEKNPRVRMQIYKFQKSCQAIDCQQDAIGQLSSLMAVIQKYGRTILESEGMIPDIKCKSEEALNKAFEFIKQQSNTRLLNTYIFNNNSSRR